MVELKAFYERLIFVRLITLLMKTALYEKKFKKTLNQVRKEIYENTESRQIGKIY